MYDIKKLEEEWTVYNKRRKLPLYIAIVFLALIILIVVLWFNKLDEKKIIGPIVERDVNNATVEKLDPKQKTASNEVTGKLVVLDTTSDSRVLEKASDESLLSQIVGPSRKKVQENELINDKTERLPYSVAQKEPVLEETESLNSVKTPSITNSDDKSSKKALKIDISDILTTNAFQDVEDRFYETKDTDDSLFLARSYFKKRDYDKALFWALQTNKVNDSIEEAWLIFAESKYEMGEKQEAKQILESYIQRTNSLKAKGLLQRLK